MNLEFLLYVIDVSSKYVWVVIIKDKKDITITKAFKKNVKEFNFKPNKRWVDKGSRFYNRSMKSWIKGADFIIDQWNHG